MSGRLVVECLRADGTRIWGYDEVASPTDRVAMAADEERVYAIRYDAARPSGVLAAYGVSSGAPLWMAPLTALGVVRDDLRPRGYENAIELRLSGTSVRVLGWESAGRYVETRDAATGVIGSLSRDGGCAGKALATNEEPDEASLRPCAIVPADAPEATPPTTETFRFQGEAPRRKPTIDVTTTNGACRLMLDGDEHETHLACASPEARWSVDRAGAFVPGGAMVAIDDARGGALYVVVFSSISSGASLEAYDLATGRPRFVRALQGLGPVDHSKYFNDADVRIGEGRSVIVSGWEAAGKYVEVLDGDTGALLGHRLAP